MTTKNLKPNSTIRMLTRREGSTWEPVEQKKVIALTQGNASEPQWANQFVEIAIACLLMDTMPPSLSHLSISVWKFGEHGFVDDRYAMAEILRKLDGQSAQSDMGAEYPLSRDDRLAICKVLGIRPAD